MRTVLYALSFLAVMGLAFWAYRENYATQKSLSDGRSAAGTRSPICAMRWPCSAPNGPISTAPTGCANWPRSTSTGWACLPFEPEQFGQPDQVAFPLPPSQFVPDVLDGIRTIDLMGATDPDAADTARGRSHQRGSSPVTRTPLRPLARILSARARGENPDTHRAREHPPAAGAGARQVARPGRRAPAAAGPCLCHGLQRDRRPHGPDGRDRAGRAANRRPRAREILAGRADLTDRNGRILATNLLTHSLYAQPQAT